MHFISASTSLLAWDLILAPAVVGLDFDELDTTSGKRFRINGLFKCDESSVTFIVSLPSSSIYISLIAINWAIEINHGLLSRALHQLDQVVEEDVSVAVAESRRLVVDLTGVVVDGEPAVPAPEMFVAPHRRAQFLSRTFFFVIN